MIGLPNINPIFTKFASQNLQNLGVFVCKNLLILNIKMHAFLIKINGTII
jgi:hypothetical protein